MQNKKEVVVQQKKINIISCITEYEPLSDKNWFGTGGIARYFAQPKNTDELIQSLTFAFQNVLHFYVIGLGANILISDQGVNGLVIKLNFQNISIKNNFEDTVQLEVGAGLSMDDLIVWCLNNQILGLEEFSGIPGTVGGSVFINLHYYEFLLEQFIESAQVLNLQTLKIETVSKDWFVFGYNYSRLHEKEYILLSVIFNLKKAKTELDIAFARGRRVEIIRHRQKRYPQKNTCGSFFRNFFMHEVPEINGEKIVYVAYYLDQVSVKGALSVGGASVSHQHANMIVTKKGATTNDIIAVARQMQNLVHQKFGIIPKPECQVLGFSHDPLLF